MKKLALLFAFSLFLFSCDKDYIVPSKEVPEWLKTIISQEEKIIQDSPRLMNSYGAWIRYKWQDTYYFEYHNHVSSSGPLAISTTQDTLRMNPWDSTTDYYKEKCCKQIVWKAPKFEDLNFK